jgi:hypothetical protein
VNTLMFWHASLVLFFSKPTFPLVSRHKSESRLLQT